MIPVSSEMPMVNSTRIRVIRVVRGWSSQKPYRLLTNANPSALEVRERNAQYRGGITAGQDQIG